MRVLAMAMLLVLASFSLGGCSTLLWWDPSDKNVAARNVPPFMETSPPDGLELVRCRDLVHIAQQYEYMGLSDQIQSAYLFGVASGYVIGYPAGAGGAEQRRPPYPTDPRMIDFQRDVGRRCEDEPNLSVLDAVRLEFERSGDAVTDRGSSRSRDRYRSGSYDRDNGYRSQARRGRSTSPGSYDSRSRGDSRYDDRRYDDRRYDDRGSSDRRFDDRRSRDDRYDDRTDSRRYDDRRYDDRGSYERR